MGDDIKTLAEIFNEMKSNSALLKSEKWSAKGYEEEYIETVEKAKVKFLDQLDDNLRQKMTDAKDILQKVRELNDQADKLLTEATSLLIDSGLGASFSVSHLGQEYCTTRNDLSRFFEVEDFAEIEDIVESFFEIPISKYSGWVHSDVC